jgi:hypothetical protein
VTLPNGQKVQAIGDPASAFVGNNDQKQPSVRVSAAAPTPQKQTV